MAWIPARDSTVSTVVWCLLPPRIWILRLHQSMPATAFKKIPHQLGAKLFDPWWLNDCSNTLGGVAVRLKVDSRA